MVSIVAGTRPEIIKLAPLYLSLKEEGVPVIFFDTCQHENDEFFDLFNIKPLRLGSRKNNDITLFAADLLKNLVNNIEKFSDVLIVQGDTVTAFIASFFAFYNRKKIVHLEAGLRTFDLNNPFPEEANRQLIARLADLHLAVTEKQKQNLINEGIGEEKIVVVGNTITDAVDMIVKSGEIKDENFVLVTIHRRENWSKIEDFIKILEKQALKGIKIKLVMHKNKKLQEKVKREAANIELIEPLIYDEFLKLLAKASFLLTDSGGIQEEVAFLGKFAVVFRKKTEREELIGKNIVLARDFKELENLLKYYWDNREKIYRKRNFVYGDGKVSKKIVEVLKWRKLI